MTAGALNGVVAREVKFRAKQTSLVIFRSRKRELCIDERTKATRHTRRYDS